MAGVCHVASRVSTMGARRHSSISSGYSNFYTNSFEMTVISAAEIEVQVIKVHVVIIILRFFVWYKFL